MIVHWEVKDARGLWHHFQIEFDDDEKGASFANLVNEYHKLDPSEVSEARVA